MANKYYWLKLKEDFFDDETIRYIEEQENGYKYSNFYLKLCLKSVRYNGRLIRLVGETLIPYDVKSLARLTGVDVDTVRCAMALLEKVGCVKILESGEIYLSQVEEMIGKETDKAAMMRRLRAEKKTPVTMLPERYPEIEKEKDTEQEKEGEQDPPVSPKGGRTSKSVSAFSAKACIENFTQDVELRELLAEWLENRKKRKAPETEGAITRNLEKLADMAQQSGLSMQDYMREVIRRGWQAFYPIRDAQPRAQRQDGRDFDWLTGQ